MGTAAYDLTINCRECGSIYSIHVCGEPPTLICPHCGYVDKNRAPIRSKGPASPAQKLKRYICQECELRPCYIECSPSIKPESSADCLASKGLTKWRRL